MSTVPPAHIEPSKHSTDEVDEFLRHVESHIDPSKDGGTRVVKPNKELGEDGKPLADTPPQP